MEVKFQMDERLNRTRILIGENGVKKLKNSFVAVVGLGGVGSYALETIARSGVGKILIMDPDKFDCTNINRQLGALTSTIGRFKSDVWRERLYDINPELEIINYNTAYTAENSSKILAYSFDYLIDAIDSVNDKIHLLKSCYQQNIPLISSMGMANRLDPTRIKVADISRTETCPLARKIRKELRQAGIHKGIKVVYSDEVPIKATATGNEPLGSIAFVPAAAGLWLAHTVVKDILVKP